MSLILICQIIFSFSLFGMLFIFLRNLPALVDFEPRPIPKEETSFFRLKKKFSEARKKMGEKFLRLRERSLHRGRVWVLKIDNFLASYLKSIQERKFHFYQRRRKEKDEEKKKRG